MKSEETRKKIDRLEELLEQEREIEQVDEYANKMALIVRSLYEKFEDHGFTKEEALDLTKIWCVKNFSQR